MGEHITEKGEFKSDKYAWCPPGFFPLKFTDKEAQPLLWQYAKVMDECGDGECANDMRATLNKAGYDGKPPTIKVFNVDISALYGEGDDARDIELEYDVQAQDAVSAIQNAIKLVPSTHVSETVGDDHSVADLKLVSAVATGLDLVVETDG